MSTHHKVFIETVNGRDFWECSCGAAGSAPEGNGDVASDRHIRPEDRRVDTNRRLNNALYDGL
jgi:hypothetical protein